MAVGLGVKQKNADILKPDGFRQSVFLLLLATLAINILSLALPVMVLQVYDRILPHPGTGTLPILVAGVCLAILLEALLRLCRAYATGRAGAAYEHRLSCNAMEKILNANLSKMGSHGVGEHLHRMGSVSKLRDFYSGYALTVLAELAFVPLFFGLIVYIAGALALVPATILLTFTAISFWKGYCLREALKNRKRADDRRFNFLIESLEGIHTLKAFALEKFFERRYEALEEDSTFANHKVTQETAGTFNNGAIFSHLMVACVISAGAWFVLQGQLTTGGLIATLLLSGRLMQPVQKALALWAQYQDYLLARAHVEELFATPQQMIKAGAPGEETVSGGRLSLSRVSFQYDRDPDPVLKDINLELKPGDAVFISGAHGAGKTTLLNLIAGIYPPSGGDIYIDNREIDSYPPEALVRHVGLMDASPLIFRGTIRDNITCFGQTPEDQAWEGAARLHVDKDVAKLPGGFDTFLNGNNTDAIPPGLKQRIAMARVLANRPGLLLFDNADQMLDRDGYTLIYSLLARLKGKISLILVTDDLNLGSLADRHYVLKNGRLRSGDNLSGRDNIRPYQELRL